MSNAAPLVEVATRARGESVWELPLPGLLPPAEPSRPSVLRRAARATRAGVGQLAEGLFGVACLILGLALLAAIPVVQFAALGYLLETSGRIVRREQLRAGWIGVRRAAHVGGLIAGTLIVLAPLWLARSLADSARLIEPASEIARRWQLAVVALSVVTAIHLVSAWARGGRLRHFFLPVVNPRRIAQAVFRRGAYQETRDALWDFVASLRLPYFWWLGFRGFCGAAIWLVLPTTLLALGQQSTLVGYLGAFALAWVAAWLPLLQVNFAAERRFSAMFAVRSVRRRTRHAPWFAAAAVIATLALAVPLYLLKIEMIPREAAWLPCLLFVAFMWPAHFLAGWAWSRALRRERPTWRLWSWPAKPVVAAVALLYVGIVFFSQFTAWYGTASLYEQHAFLLPAPFLVPGR